MLRSIILLTFYKTLPGVNRYQPIYNSANEDQVTRPCYDRWSSIEKAIPKKRGSVLDIGSNIGSVTLPLANTFKKSQVYSIEPTIYAFEKLKENINLNPDIKKRIKTFNYFISKKKK